MVNREALNQMVRVLRAVDPDEFDLRFWKCGSVCCAIGSACEDPWFRERGLKLGGDEDIGYCPVFGNKRSWAAVSEFFGLADGQAEYLFSSRTYNQLHPEPEDVIRRIRGLLTEPDHAEDVLHGVEGVWEPDYAI